MTLGFRDAGLAHVRIERISAETLEASARPSRPAAPASDETSSYAICSYGADRVEHLRNRLRSGRPKRRRCREMRWDARISDCGLSEILLRARTIWTLVVAALTKVGSSGVERADKRS